jgi:hypothetical protein
VVGEALSVTQAEDSIGDANSLAVCLAVDAVAALLPEELDSASPSPPQAASAARAANAKRPAAERAARRAPARIAPMPRMGVSKADPRLRGAHTGFVGVLER